MTDPNQTTTQSYNKFSHHGVIAVLALCGAPVVLAAVYEIAHWRSNPANAACAGGVETAARIAPRAHGAAKMLQLAIEGT